MWTNNIVDIISQAVIQQTYEKQTVRMNCGFESVPFTINSVKSQHQKYLKNAFQKTKH